MVILAAEFFVDDVEIALEVLPDPPNRKPFFIPPNIPVFEDLGAGAGVVFLAS